MNNLFSNSSLDDEESKALVASLRSILLQQDLGRLQALEKDISELRTKYKSQDYTAQIEDILFQLRNIQERIHHQADRANTLELDVDLLQRKAQEDAEGIVERLNPVMTRLVRRTIHESPNDMAEALGPVMGEAIRVQIRDSRQEMVDALYPVIGETVQRAVSEFTREFQRNIDKRLKATFGPRGFFNRVWARLRGVSDAELALRNFLPFTLKEIFLIQQQTGLLLAHAHPGSEDIQDSNLISAMLTAIRDFMRDSFKSDQASEQTLDEIQYGQLRIVIATGKQAYIAVVIEGVEQEGFHAALHEYLAELHTRFSNVLKTYDGDTSTLPNLQAGLAQLVMELTGEQPRHQMTRGQKITLGMAGLGMILLAALACFYLQFTIALYPIAFPTATKPMTPTSTATVTYTPTSTATSTATSTTTPLPTITLTSTSTSTPTQTFTPSPTPKPGEGYIITDAWVRDGPDNVHRNWIVILRQTPVKILAVYGNWMQISWVTENNIILTGWIPSQWVKIITPIPDHYITTTAVP